MRHAVTVPLTRWEIPINEPMELQQIRLCLPASITQGAFPLSELVITIYRANGVVVNDIPYVSEYVFDGVGVSTIERDTILTPFGDTVLLPGDYMAIDGTLASGVTEFDVVLGLQKRTVSDIDRLIMCAPV